MNSVQLLKYFIVIYFIFLSSCDFKQEKNDSRDFLKSQSNDCVSLTNLKEEIFDFKEIKINGNIPLIAPKEQIFALFGKPTKVEQLQHASLLSNIYLGKLNNIAKYYFGNTVFEGNQDTLILSKLDFESSNVTLVHPKITISRKTALDTNFLKVFPESIKLKSFNCGNTCFGVLKLKAYKELGDGEEWNLFFNANILKKISFIIPD